ncbi:DNA gyrase subunit A [Haliangium ochraceum]|uniref:DNA gyrase subunit A n=1 Tax=Haliangium ochraceum (strain DSM 14365 / JCM 11303 / SMP-2) TaxID=502025 RepID=D0LNR4_HALO1|nr:DNA gyrase subunit A [Haliangium ochraceum]ACY16969.1 DNA gyrase, A subunit [Haliangium ochraceum DSM 14365]
MSDIANVTPVAIEKEMRSSFMDYAMSVIISRALPDARDGLKPVHRRILFAQKGLSNYWNRPYLKCARIVGDVIGKYHPHGDSSVYDALVRMAQDFSMRYELVDGQGNFGSIDGDPPAAMRYTECRMARLASDLLADLDKETVDWQPNYDDKELEPTVLPTKVPNLLLNGASGIAVGMATNIPPHNLGEILDATMALMEDPDLPEEELAEIVPGPDFPTGGIIHGRGGIRAAHTLGRGAVVIRGRTQFETVRKERKAIVVTEMPFMVNKSRWIETTAHLVRDKRIDGISDIRDESDRKGIRVVFELKRDANEQVVLNNLFKMTALQTSFNVNMLAIVDGRPQVLSLRSALQVFIEHRRTVVRRRCLFELRQARERREIVEGLGLAVMQIDRVIEIIRTSKDTDEAKARLMSERMMGLDGFLERAGRPADEVEAVRTAGFVHLSARQAQAILDMRLGRLTGLEREKVEAEYRELWEITDYLEGILGDDVKLRGVIVDELREMRDQYADPRRTEIVDQEGEILDEQLIKVEDMVVTRTRRGYVKRTALDEYSAQGRGGKGVRGAASGDDDFVADMFVASTHDHLLMFTNIGRVYQKKVYELPSGSRISKGRPFVNVIEALQPDEYVVGMLPVKEFTDDLSAFMATRMGTVKKTVAAAFSRIRVTGIKAIGIDDGDELVEVRLTRPDMDVLLVTKRGQSIRFQEDQVRPMGREARGVRGIGLAGGDAVVGMSVFERDCEDAILTVCENGYGKRTLLSAYSTQGRGGKGLITIKTTERNGPVSGVRLVGEDDHVIMISSTGKLIRMRVRDIPVQSRATQGVRLMRLDPGEQVASLERLAEPDDDADSEAVTPELGDDDEIGNEVDEAGEGDAGADDADDSAADADAGTSEEGTEDE